MAPTILYLNMDRTQVWFIKRPYIFQKPIASALWEKLPRFNPYAFRLTDANLFWIIRNRRMRNVTYDKICSSCKYLDTASDSKY